MSFSWDPDHLAFAHDHVWGLLATGRQDGSPQQSMIGYYIDDDGRIVISAKAYTAKWNNAVRQPSVSMAIADGRTHMVIYGVAETISEDPERAEAHREDLRGALRWRCAGPDIDRPDARRTTTHDPADRAREGLLPGVSRRPLIGYPRLVEPR